MKNIFVVALVLIVQCTLYIENSIGQWEKLKFEDSLSVSSFVVKGNKLYAGTSQKGVFISTDYGLSWNTYNNVLSKQNIQALMVSGEDIFAGTWDSGIFISTNDGVDWTEINNGLQNKKVLCFTLLGGNIYAGMYDERYPGGVFLTTDKGNSWKGVNTGFSSKESCVALAVIENNILAASQYEGLYMSTNSGKELKCIGFDRIEITNITVSGKTIFAATRYDRIQYSTNFGEKWEYLEGDLFYEPVSTLYTVGSQLFAGRVDGIICAGKECNSIFPINKNST